MSCSLIAAIGILGLFALSCPVDAYEEDVHFFVTMFLAESAGFSSSEASMLARFDQATDDDPNYSPLPSRSDLLAIQHRAQYHFVSPARFVALEEAAFSTCDLKQIGIFLHALEDFYAHKDYEPVWGHTFSGHAPDKTYKNPSLAIGMANRKFFELTRLIDTCRENTKPLRQWGHIRVKMLDFLKATPPQGGRQKSVWNTDPNRLKLLLDGDLARYQQAWRDYQAWKQQQGW